MKVAKKTVPKEFREYLRALGRAGGKKSLETMTPEERTERAKRAAAAGVAKRKAAKKGTSKKKGPKK